jgi:hypothetical protein
MTYVSPNFQTKKALKEALSQGKTVSVWEPGVGTAPRNGAVWLEGPHFPQPHRWYGEGIVKDGKLIKIS